MNSKNSRFLDIEVSVDNTINGIENFLRMGATLIKKDEEFGRVALTGVDAAKGTIKLKIELRREVQLVQHTNGKSYKEKGLQKRIRGIPCETSAKETSSGS